MKFTLNLIEFSPRLKKCETRNLTFFKLFVILDQLFFILSVKLTNREHRLGWGGVCEGQSSRIRNKKDIEIIH